MLYVDLHLVHEVTSAQAFDGLRMAGRKVRRTDLTIATADHNTPTRDRSLPIADATARQQLEALSRNCSAFGVTLFEMDSPDNGIVHVIGPEQGYTQPGKLIVCGDSHTSTHGALGAVAFGIGTSQVRDVLATQCLAMARPKLRRIDVTGKLAAGVYAKDVTLTIIRQLGVKGGVGFAYEYAGPVIDAMTIEERLTVCNMSIEGGARCGYVNPDEATIDYLRGREYSPTGDAWERAAAHWRAVASDADATYDDRVEIDGNALAPSVTWGINPGQSVGVDEKLPRLADAPRDAQAGLAEAFEYMGLRPGEPIAGTKVDVAFIGSCTNGRISDLREAARVAKSGKVAAGVRTLVVPGSQAVARQAQQEGLPEVFRTAGFDWREAGCSMCLAMNPDKLVGREVCASSSNRNFKGRQGSPTGRTLLMSPAMVAAAALKGEVADVREVL
ncbi:MAG: 3-isopropylmalate dehydratase large subunit [Myxococcota bacterium]|nr:3-isopropylmalate dehydratase large subunit [Myxococcota bacterium]